MLTLFVSNRLMHGMEGALIVEWLVVLFFFFQAEDGIRDVAVTGVQTCALPICNASSRPSRSSARSCARPTRRAASANSCRTRPAPAAGWRTPLAARPACRSEERRVGKSVDLGGRRIIKKKKKKIQQRAWAIDKR